MPRSTEAAHSTVNQWRNGTVQYLCFWPLMSGCFDSFASSSCSVNDSKYITQYEFPVKLSLFLMNAMGSHHSMQETIPAFLSFLLLLSFPDHGSVVPENEIMYVVQWCVRSTCSSFRIFSMTIGQVQQLSFSSEHIWLHQWQIIRCHLHCTLFMLYISSSILQLHQSEFDFLKTEPRDYDHGYGLKSTWSCIMVDVDVVQRY